ncbi:MAG: hypothetical protein Q9162_006042 [Coniocarpon cinnabarinum]
MELDTLPGVNSDCPQSREHTMFQASVLSHRDGASEFPSWMESPGDPAAFRLEPTWEQQQQPQAAMHLVNIGQIRSEPTSIINPQTQLAGAETKASETEDPEQIDGRGHEIARVRSWLEHSALNPNCGPSNTFSDSAGEKYMSPLLLPALNKEVHGNVYAAPQTSRTALPDSPRHSWIDTLSQSTGRLQTGDRNKSDVHLSADSRESMASPVHLGSVLPDMQSKRGDSAVGAQDAHRYHTSGPWADIPDRIDDPRLRAQPASSNAAIGVFLRKARDLETASLAATLGSRRRSEADLTSIASSRDGANVGGPLAPGASRQASLFRRLLIRRDSSSSSSSTKKRKDVQMGGDSAQVSECAAPKHLQGQGGLSPLKRVIIRPKSPRLDMSGNHRSSNHRSPTKDRAKRTLSMMQRPRSTISSTGASPLSSALAEQWARQGGPPVPSLRPQEHDLVAFEHPHPTQEGPIHSPDDLDGDEDVLQETSAAMPLRIIEAPEAPSKEAFAAHIRKLNPRIEPYMLNRLVTEQDKRFRRLLESRTRHAETIHRRVCATGEFCNSLGKGPKYPAPSVARNADSSTPIFWVADASPPAEGPDDSEKAHFPEGIPLPPVSRLPAEFECPLCFQVKKISERHRHLEAWQCDLDGCYHKCYRRDNFVQHLVREHRLPEPTKIGKSAYRTGSDPSDVVAQHVERCREDSSSVPGDEPCRFCRAQCSTWKKLSVHLAQHMQQISIPTLRLIGIEIPSSTPPMQAGISGGYYRHSATPMEYTSPGSRTPSTSVTGSGGRSHPQSSVSSGEGWEPNNPPLVSVTSAEQSNDPVDHRMTPPSKGWSRSSRSMSGKDLSTYPVMGPPPSTQAQSGSGLGLTFGAEVSPRPEMAAQGHYYANTSMAPQTPSGGYSGTPHPTSATFGPVWQTYPPPGLDSSGEQTHMSPFEMQGVLPGPPISDSPVETSMADFSTASSYHVMSAGGAGYNNSMAAPGQEQAPFYGMPSDMQFSMPPGPDQGYATSRRAFIQQMEDRNEPQQYHGATYPPPYYHPASR